MKFKLSVIQMVSNSVVTSNLRQARSLLEKAKSQKANMAILPENFSCMPKKDSKLVSTAELENKGPIFGFLSDISKKLSMWILAPVPLKTKNESKIKQALLVFDDQGILQQRYDKIHLFDVLLPNNESYAESLYTSAGNFLKTVKTPWCVIGLSICYDLRFPNMYRKLVNMGADLIVVPSSFANTTGMHHWMTLLKARAIENLVFVAAPNQGGSHPNGRKTFGHTTIINPWGLPLDIIKTGSGIITTQVDFDQQKKIRQNFPALQHKKKYK
jgi:deaminated glutathione amidase